MSHHPHHAIISDEDNKVLITVSGSTIFVFSTESDTLISTSATVVGTHKDLIRFICTYFDAVTGSLYLVSTGEDKMLMVWKVLPQLELMSSRELNKRANAMCIRPDGTIAIGDKFGDIFSYELLPLPVAPLAKGEVAVKPSPIAGHVSMLTALVLVPEAKPFIQRDLVISGDRDEHVRASRWPLGHVIERYMFGSHRFVSALEYIPPTTAHPTPLILSAGGDPTLQSFNLATGALIAQIPVSVFNASILAAPEASVLIDHGKKAQQKRNVAEGRNKRQGKDQNLKGKGKQAELVIEVEDGGDDDEEMHAVEEVEDVPVENSAIVPLRLGKMRYDGKLKGLAICKIVRIGDRDTGGVILIASGASIVMFIPISRLDPSSPSTTVAETVTLDLHHPILDISIIASSTSFYASLDLSKGPTIEGEGRSLRQIELINGKLVLIESVAKLEQVVLQSSALVSETSPFPNASSLYPALLLLHNPEDFTPEDKLSSNNAKRFKPQETVVSVAHTARQTWKKTGRRAIGRAAITEKFQQAEAAAKETASGSATPSIQD